VRAVRKGDLHRAVRVPHLVDKKGKLIMENFCHNFMQMLVINWTIKGIVTRDGLSTETIGV
jgi:hypothetical protein